MTYLNLTNKIEFNKDTIESPNLCEHFAREDLDRIGSWVYDNFTRDKASRKPWEDRMESAISLAMQLQKDKTFPWAGCSNVAFPLVTIAALQFHARAYPAIVNGRSVVQTRIIGEDPQGIARARADKISSHMSWQLLEQDEAWEEGQDRGLLNVAIVGCGFKKTYYDNSQGFNISTFVPAKDLVVNYWAKSIDSAACKTHIIPLYKNEVHERAMRGTYEDCLAEPWYTGVASTVNNQRSYQQDDRAGVVTPISGDDTPFTMLEQHCWMDLDNDGYDEPYIVTIEESSQQVLRIVARCDRIEDIEYNSKGDIVRITAKEYFTKIPFIPSPDSGIYDIGFGILLGPLNESVNTVINQLLDAGTVSNTAGGFLGRGAKIRGGQYEFKPFGWHRVDATGDDLRKSLVPLPVREPSAIMFNLLSLLIDYTGRISGATDMLVGENPGQNTPAETSRAMLEQGQKIYSAIFKRIWRSMKQEFKKLYQLNALYLPDKVHFGENETIGREDYAISAVSVLPVADPTISSDGARFARAQMIAERAQLNPGYDTDGVERELLRTLGVEDAKAIYPGVAGQEQGPSEKVQIQQMKNDAKAMELQQEQMQFIITMQENARVNNAKILQMEATARRLEQEADGEPARRNVEAFRAAIEAVREQNNAQNAHLDRLMENLKNGNQGAGGTVQRLAGPPSNETIVPMGAG